MAIYYHGTSLEKGFAIADAGKIVTPLEQVMEYLLKHFGSEEQFFKMSGKDLNKTALEIAMATHADHERETKVKGVRLFNYENAFIDSSKFEDANGGIMLGIEAYFPETLSSIVIPGSVGLENLKEICVTPKAHKYNRQIQSAFAKYSPKFFLLRD